MELWSDGQTRRTLLLDPGRIKQGVGPNVKIGAPLKADRSYQLVVDGRTLDANARPIGTEHVHTFRVGPSEQRRIDPNEWSVLRPEPGTREPVTVGFDRLMDRAIVRRALRVLDGNGSPFPDEVSVGDRSWTFVPSKPWSPVPVSLSVDPVLEDVAGNTVCHPFDAAAESARQCDERVVIDLAEAIESE